MAKAGGYGESDAQTQKKRKKDSGGATEKRRRLLGNISPKTIPEKVVFNIKSVRIRTA